MGHYSVTFPKQYKNTLCSAFYAQSKSLIIFVYVIILDNH